MTAAKATDTDELRMSAKEFDRIMSQAIRVKPEDAKKLRKRSAKTKKARKKKIARK